MKPPFELNDVVTRKHGKGHFLFTVQEQKVRYGTWFFRENKGLWLLSSDYCLLSEWG